MLKINTSRRKHHLKFESIAEAINFRNTDYLQQLAANIARRKKYHDARRAGESKGLMRASKLPRIPGVVAIDPRRLELEFIVKHGDYARLDNSTGCFLQREWERLRKLP